jgi:hypothetical protein
MRKNESIGSGAVRLFQGLIQACYQKLGFYTSSISVSSHSRSAISGKWSETKRMFLSFATITLLT